MPRRHPAQLCRFTDSKFTVVAEPRPGRATFRARAWYRGSRPVEETAISAQDAVITAERIWLAYLAGEIDAVGPLALRDLADMWLATVRNPATLRAYRQVATCLVAEFGGDADPRAMTTARVTAWLVGMSHVRPQTRETYRRTAMTFINWLVSRKHLVSAPDVEHFAKGGPVMRPWLPTAEWQTYLDACTPEHRIRSGFALETGVRKGEVIHARWSWIHHVGDGLSLRVAADAVTGFAPKWAQARAIPLSMAAQTWLEAARARWTEGDFIFANERLKAPSWAESSRSACAAARVTSVDFHGLRRSACVRWLEASMPITAVSKLMGHKDVTTTMRYYGAITDPYLQSCVAALDTGAGASGQRALASSTGHEGAR